ncbi:MAG TPA: hypothetical protein VHB30_07725, partial [Solirubrobacteraceae bacterium]|nr:hypothetical protein [Solirubrobacteraceae bacterium]
VAGPWVLIPGSAGATASARWEMTCPEGGVGGTDARVSEARVGVSFPGRTGSPVGPGVTVDDAVVFEGRYSGTAHGHATSFRPFLGCVPGGGGQRVPTSAPSTAPVAVAAASPLRPGQPVTVRTRTLRVTPGSLARGSLACRRGERLLRATTAVGLLMEAVPSAAHMRAVRVVRTTREGRVLVSATRRGLAGSIGVEVQIQAECAR